MTLTWVGVRNRAILMEDTSDAQVIPVRLYLHPSDAEDEEHNSCWGGPLLSKPELGANFLLSAPGAQQV